MKSEDTLNTFFRLSESFLIFAGNISLYFLCPNKLDVFNYIFFILFI